MKEKQKVYIIHAHTVLSERDAIAKIEDYALRIKQLNANSSKYEICGMSITEHGNCRSMVSSRVELENHNLKHILGAELYLCSNEQAKISSKRFHFVVMPSNDGYEDFIHLMSKSGHNKYQKNKNTKAVAITNIDVLKEHGKNLIATTACLAGLVPKLILDDNYDKAKNVALLYRKYVKELYLEVQPHDTKDQIKVNAGLVKMSKETGLPLVIGLDCHYAKKEEEPIKKAFNKMVSYIDKMSKNNEDVEEDIYYNHIRSFEEIEEYCVKHDIPLSAISNTSKIAKACENVDYKPKSATQYMPEFEVPKGYTTHSYLTHLALNSLNKKILKHEFTNAAFRIKRLLHELNIIELSGFSGYFLVLWDWMSAMRKKGILMGPGRGCFLPNNKIRLSDGTSKLIKDISISDEVMNKDSKGIVLDTLGFLIDEEVLRIETYGGKVLTCTKDHKIYMHIIDSYIKASTLKKGDILTLRKYKYNNYKEDLHLTTLGEFVGMYLRFSKNIYDTDILMYSDEKLIEKFKELYMYMHINIKSKIKVTDIHSTGHKKVMISVTKTALKKIHKLLKDNKLNYAFEKGLVNGFFKREILNLNFEKLYFSGVQLFATFYNKDVETFIDDVLYRQNIFTTKTKSMQEYYLNVSKCCINDMLLKSNFPTIDLNLNINRLRIFSNDDNFFVKVKDIKKIKYKGPVYDLTISSDPSYTVNDFVVHNSAAGSLVNFVLGITNVDPIEHDLLFSRFLNPERIEAPDIDTDIITSRRREGVEYFKTKYGEHNVSQIITFTRFGVKTIVQNVVKMMGGSAQEANELSKSLENVSFQKLKDAYEHPESQEGISAGLLNKYHKNYESMLELVKKRKDLAPLIKRGSGLINGVGLHPAGVIISKVDMRGVFPTEASTSSTAVLPVLSICMEDVGYFGLLKVDVLGLKTLQIIQDGMEAAGLGYDWWDDLDTSDKNVYDMLHKIGGTADIFQLSAPTPSRLIRAYNVQDINGLSADSASNRPSGVAKHELLDNRSMIDVVTEYTKTGVLESLGLKEADEVVKVTGGAALYQEQIQLIGKVVGGYSTGGADLRLRKVIGNTNN